MDLRSRAQNSTFKTQNSPKLQLERCEGRKSDNRLTTPAPDVGEAGAGKPKSEGVNPVLVQQFCICTSRFVGLALARIPKWIGPMIVQTMV